MYRQRMTVSVQINVRLYTNCVDSKRDRHPVSAGQVYCTMRVLARCSVKDPPKLNPGSGRLLIIPSHARPSFLADCGFTANSSPNLRNIFPRLHVLKSEATYWVYCSTISLELIRGKWVDYN